MNASITKLVEDFFSQYTRLKYKKGDVILRGEDTPQGALYLKKGYVRQYAIGDLGTALMLHIFKPGAFFPMTWVVNGTPNGYFYEAVTPVEIWRAPKEAVINFLKNNPKILLDLTSRLLFGVTGIMKRMEHLVMDDAYTKTILLLVYMAQNLGIKTGTRVELPVPLTHREVAAWIGTTRETASIQVEKLKKKKLIQYRKRILVIPNLETLAKSVNQ